MLTWLGGVFVWFSDSTNPVLVGPICRSFTDKVKVSREKLAYIVDSTTAAVPTLFPISAWGAYIIGLIATFYTSTGYTGNPQTDFVAGIPYQYYTIGSILMVLIIAVTGWDYGPMKKAEDRRRDPPRGRAGGASGRCQALHLEYAGSRHRAAGVHLRGPVLHR